MTDVRRLQEQVQDLQCLNESLQGRYEVALEQLSHSDNAVDMRILRAALKLVNEYWGDERNETVIEEGMEILDELFGMYSLEHPQQYAALLDEGNPMRYNDWAQATEQQRQRLEQAKADNERLREQIQVLEQSNKELAEQLEKAARDAK